ncbi:MAG: PQQ-binding-like beta-propeller repeat protein [Verrucomicrobiia bacterium]
MSCFRSIVVAAACLFWNGADGLEALAAESVQGWLHARGPLQSGVSLEKGLPDQIDAGQALWVADYPGQSTAVVANGKVYILGYRGDGPDLKEGVACFDASSGKKLWEQGYTDFLSDTIYLRYATSSPTVDPETGNIYIQGTQGILAGLTSDGQLLWQHSMMEKFGRLTFPNSRTATPVVDRDLVITRGITANWGGEGPAGDRFYAFDKNSGELVWSSNPGVRPRDNSFSHPYLGFAGGKRVLYAASGDGSVVCLNARTGDPLWRVELFKAGINATVLVHNHDKVIAIFGTPYEPGQMVALRIPEVPNASDRTGPAEFERSQLQLWANNLSTSTSSPILVGDRIYVVTEKGALCSVDALTGKVLWELNIGIEQRNSSPLFADGKLYVPMLDDPMAKNQERSEAGTKGALYVIDPDDGGGKILSHTTLDGRCFGSPAVYQGKIYVQTTSRLYCFGKPGAGAGPTAAAISPSPEKWPEPGPPQRLQIIPSEVLLHPGQTASFRVRTLDAHGFTVGAVQDIKTIRWAPYIPPTARVRSEMKASFDKEGRLVAAPDPAPSAGAFEARMGNLRGLIRGRVLPNVPFEQDFEAFSLSETTTNAFENPTPFAYPPLPWIGARFKFEVRDKDGTKALTKTIDNKFFQRAFVFMGDPEMSQYTIEADVMSEGNRRKMSDVGIINQRYLVVLKGNEQKLEVNSNLERLRVPATEEPPNFRWQPNVWYRLKARVDTTSNGSGAVRAKAWKRSEPEPDAWTIEVPVNIAHQSGSPGLFGFSPQEMRVFIDNVKVTPNR